MSFSEAKIIEFPIINDTRGNLSFIEGNNHIPFEIKRVFYLFDIPGGAYRGAHAHINLQQVIIAMSGSFDVLLNDGNEERKYHLNRSYLGLYVPKMLWSYLDNFSTGSISMVLASDLFDENDYIRDYKEFIKYKKI
jgi:hypothetical protein